MQKRITLLVVVMFLTYGFLPLLCADATEIKNSRSGKQNVVFVIDGSGSLISVDRKPGTDHQGLRYDAIRQFLGFMTDSGNYINAIVFNGVESENLDMEDALVLNTGLMPINGRLDKDELFNQIKSARVNGSTDIGTALLSASKSLRDNRQSADLQSSIILLTDGKSDLPTAKLLEQSLANKQEAIAIAQKMNVPIHCICLNVNDWADVDEMQAIADATGGLMIEVNSAADLESSYNSFYKEIFGGTFINNDGLLADFMRTPFTVPGAGIEEINISIKSDQEIKWELFRPSGILIDEDERQRLCTEINRNHILLKIIRPIRGEWILELDGDSSTRVEFNWVYNLDVSADVAVLEEESTLHRGGQVFLDTWLNQNGERLSSFIYYQGYTGAIHVRNADGTNSVLPIELSEAGTKQSLSLKSNGRYTIWATYSCGNVVITSRQLILDITNTPPQVVTGEPYVVKKMLFPFGKTQIDIELQGLFSDVEDTQLKYSLENVEGYESALSINSGVLTLDAAALGNASIFVAATDESGATASLEVQVKVVDLTPIVWGIVGFALLAIVLILLKIFVNCAKKNLSQAKTRIPGTFNVQIEINGLEGQYHLIDSALRNHQRVPLETVIREYLRLVESDDLVIGSDEKREVEKRVEEHQREINENVFWPEKIKRGKEMAEGCIWEKSRDSSIVLQYGDEHTVFDRSGLKLRLQYLDSKGEIPDPSFFEEIPNEFDFMDDEINDETDDLPEDEGF